MLLLFNLHFYPPGFICIELLIKTSHSSFPDQCYILLFFTHNVVINSLVVLLSMFFANFLVFFFFFFFGSVCTECVYSVPVPVQSVYLYRVCSCTECVPVQRQCVPVQCMYPYRMCSTKCIPAGTLCTCTMCIWWILNFGHGSFGQPYYCTLSIRSCR